VPHYLLSGLRVDADIDLPGVVSRQAAHPDALIRRGDVPAPAAHLSRAVARWTKHGADIILHVRDAARIMVSQGRVITYSVAPGAPVAGVLPFLTGTAFGVLLLQRGLMVLHASAIATTRGAVLFCGRSGAGKSTLAAALSQRGHALIADDIAVIDRGPDGHPHVRQDSRDIKLWADTLAGLALEARRRAEMQLRLGKYYVASDAADGPAVHRVAAIYVLEPSAEGASQASRSLGAAAASSRLRALAYRPRLVHAVLGEASHFAMSADIVRRVPVLSLRVPRGFDRLPAALDALEASWIDAGDGAHVARGGSS
jgi:hypothetical protein